MTQRGNRGELLISGEDPNADSAPGEGFEPSVNGTKSRSPARLDDPGKFGT